MGRRPGTVVKRRQSAVSSHTTMSTLSSVSSGTPRCQYCGHRCCRRRFEYEARRSTYRKNDKRKKRGTKKTIAKRNLKNLVTGSKGIQAGSRAVMLSPLCIKSNAPLPTPGELPEQQIDYCEITPEMIYQSLRRLTMWKQHVMTDLILDYLKRNYPVNPDDTELQHELTEKLRIAAIVEIVTRVGEEHWSLNCALQNRRLSKSHVTRFWDAYADTLKPIVKS